MDDRVKSFILNVKVDRKVAFENMTVFGLKLEGGNGFEYATLDEALEENFIEVAEEGEEGVVPEIVVKNGSDKDVLLVDGEELVGAKQNRILNTSVMIPRKSETKIPVSCVERGRWSYRSQRFGSGSSTHIHLRMEKAKQVSDSLSESGQYRSNQRRVWQEVSRKSRAMKVESPSEAIHEVYKSYEERLEEYARAFSEMDEVNGIAVAINGRIVCADIFDKTSTMKKMFKKLMQGYALDALEEHSSDAPEVQESDAVSFFQRAAESESDTYPSTGIGEDVRISGDRLVGSSLVCNDHVVHVGLFTAG